MMSNSIIIIVIIVLIVIYYISKNFNKEDFLTKDIFEVNTDHRLLSIIRKMLKDIDGLFRKYNIMYWIDGGTLLGAVRHQDIIPWDDDADICIWYNDAEKFLALERVLYEMGYGLTKFWGGYKIYPLNGISVKFYNRNWHWSQTHKDIADRENFNYKYPFVDIMLCRTNNGKVEFSNQYAQRVWSKFYHNKKDLWPLKRYRIGSAFVNGPNNPIPYLNRGYGNDWRSTGYKAYDHQNMRFIPLVKFKVNQKRDI